MLPNGIQYAFTFSVISQIAYTLWVLPLSLPLGIFLGNFLSHCFQLFHFFALLFSVSQITDLKFSVDLLEKERDFYFAKLRDIEIICQTPSEADNISVRNLMKHALKDRYTFIVY